MAFDYAQYDPGDVGHPRRPATPLSIIANSAYYGAYSNAARGKRRKAAAVAEPSGPTEAPERDTTVSVGAARAALRRRWAEMIRRVYEVDPLV